MRALIGARRGPIAVSIKVIATVDVSKGDPRRASCIVRCSRDAAQAKQV
jgi:hypothetical protein